MTYLTHKKLKKAIDSLDEFSKAAFDEPCDEEKAKSALLNFYSVWKTIKADKTLIISNTRGGYYSFMIKMIPFMKALDRKKYALACHELRTLCHYEPILQQRIYCNLMLLYREYLEEWAND